MLLVIGVAAILLDVAGGRFYFSMLVPSAWIAALLLWPRPDGIEFSLFGWLWVVSLALPAALFCFDRQTAVITGVVTPIIWCVSMPCGCIGGAFAAFPMTGVQLGSLAFWVARITAIAHHASL
jgi:hypothetical protein